MPDVKKKKNILHIVEWIVALIVAGCLADVACFHCGKHLIRNQFIDATIFGYFIISSLVFVCFCVDEEIPEKTLWALCCVGAALYLITGILVVMHYDQYSDTNHNHYHGDERMVVGGAFCFFNFIVYLAEFFISILKKDLLE